MTKFIAGMFLYRLLKDCNSGVAIVSGIDGRVMSWMKYANLAVYHLRQKK